ncbi:2-phospho-L-lactate guanylyltransferase [Terrabacter sp. MAHUQ-38]|uniref:2-phospho-L-lactate guanylyltransferase n=1 Tax=unclassified Terrabacter TaxID=2630222 RepID=UPI00165D7383|nr:2-phospho-L-lactate guanylyltransferase [Terrabacter sp. MAHUQ-38]MBC9821529.1 2-phospho-L-lactate guanylyltransferase [Terrabacter sp. MAHUQ-38]
MTTSSAAPHEPLVSDRAVDWHVVVPVKDTGHGKSRLARAVGSDRVELSAAIANDTLAAVLDAVGPDRLVLVTGDVRLSAAWRARGAHVVIDPGNGLNAAVTEGMRYAGPGAQVAALLGDLPALDAASLEAALAAAGDAGESFVPDADGTGTVMRCGTGFTPRFGADSASRHAADGAVLLDLPLPRLRTDVDDARSLSQARRLGLGPQTRAVLEHRASGWIRSMQASVHRFDPETHTGSVLRDDGVELRFEAAAFDASGLRLLRVGQRLTIDVVDDHVVGLRIVGVGAGQAIH